MFSIFANITIDKWCEISRAYQSHQNEGKLTVDKWREEAIVRSFEVEPIWSKRYDLLLLVKRRLNTPREWIWYWPSQQLSLDCKRGWQFVWCWSKVVFLTSRKRFLEIPRESHIHNCVGEITIWSDIVSNTIDR